VPGEGPADEGEGVLGVQADRFVIVPDSFVVLPLGIPSATAVDEGGG